MALRAFKVYLISKRGLYETAKKECWPAITLNVVTQMMQIDFLLFKTVTVILVCRSVSHPSAAEGVQLKWLDWGKVIARVLRRLLLCWPELLLLLQRLLRLSMVGLKRWQGRGAIDRALKPSKRFDTINEVFLKVSWLLKNYVSNQKWFFRDWAARSALAIPTNRATSQRRFEQQIKSPVS